MYKPIVDMSMRLSAHFTLGELCNSATAANYKPKPIPNIPLKQNIVALQNLVDRALEPLRQHLGLPIYVNSGYRCPLVNTLVHGRETSQHMKGEAADITILRENRPFGHSSDEQAVLLLFKYAREYADFDQLIIEHYGSSWWLHISCKIDYHRNRRDKLRIENGKTTRID